MWTEIIFPGVDLETDETVIVPDFAAFSARPLAGGTAPPER